MLLILKLLIMSMIVEIALGQMIKCNKIEQWTVEL